MRRCGGDALLFTPTPFHPLTTLSFHRHGDRSRRAVCCVALRRSAQVHLIAEQVQQKQRADAAAAAPSPIIERPLTKKERDRVNKGNNTDEAVHARANETAALALGGKKKKYSWMDMGKGGGGSGKSTPRSNANTGGGGSGAATPAVAQQDVALNAKKREFRGGDFEKGENEGKIQLRDLVHVLELDGKERKALTQIIARMRSGEPDGKPEERPRPAPATPLAR